MNFKIKHNFPMGFSRDEERGLSNCHNAPMDKIYSIGEYDYLICSKCRGACIPLNAHDKCKICNKKVAGKSN